MGQIPVFVNWVSTCMFDYPNEDVKDKHLTRATITDGWNNLWQKHNVIIQITRPSIVRYDVTQSQFSEEQNPQPREYCNIHGTFEYLPCYCIKTVSFLKEIDP